MALFLFAIMLALAGTVLLSVRGILPNDAAGRAAGVLALLVALGVLSLSTAIYVDDDKGGIVIRKFGPDLPPNRVVAANGEKGPQAEVLGPGWHFSYWPWLYDLHLVDTITIDPGFVGVVSALDGRSLPSDLAFAPEWPHSQDLLDGGRFLSSGEGYRGPQLTVLTPGRYRYNPRLFEIIAKRALTVDVNEVAVIKSNAGVDYKPSEGEATDVANGTPLVPEGFRGIWRTPRTPGTYYMHPDAHNVVKVRTTKRTYTYQDKQWAIRVRSKDGFTFPVGVRVACSVAANDAPRLVAQLGNPDQETKDGQETEALSELEVRVILPLIRTIFRNVAEDMNALQFVNSRSKVEQMASQVMRAELAKFHLASDGVFIDNIDLDETDAGKQLLATQTEREVAVNQQATFKEKQSAEEARARFILAQEEAEQQRMLAQAKYQVLVREQEAKAREVEAQGEARYITITADARQGAYTAMAQSIGAQGVMTLELFKLIADSKVQITPQVMVTGGASGGAMDALAGTILGRSLMPAVAPAPAEPEKRTR